MDSTRRRTAHVFSRGTYSVHREISDVDLVQFPVVCSASARGRERKGGPNLIFSLWLQTADRRAAATAVSESREMITLLAKAEGLRSPRRKARNLASAFLDNAKISALFHGDMKN